MAIRVADAEEREQAGPAEHADAEAGALALLGQLGLGQPDLGADQLGNLGGQLVAPGRPRVGSDPLGVWLRMVRSCGPVAIPGVFKPLDRSRRGGRRRRPARRLRSVAGRIREEDIAEVREKARIDDVVTSYVTLRNAGGGSMKGLCPFHDEKSPSFNVTPSAGSTTASAAGRAATSSSS